MKLAFLSFLARGSQSVSDSQLIVLKFGGSVLLDEQRLRIAVHEIYRWRREGWRVIAVVSALAGKTEELIARSNRLSDSASDQSKASLIASGEIESASYLGIHLDRAGLPARVLSPASIGLIARGDPLDADPVSINRAIVQRAIDETGIVVIPGFVAINESGSTVTLGRGGSDLTAVYLTHALNADRCRLIKDVDGLYESDPSISSPPPRRFECVRYEDALGTDGSIIQHKAILFARLHDIEFELGEFNGLYPTRIGTAQTVYGLGMINSEPTSVAICGLGTVGQGVLELIGQLPDMFSITGAACQSPAKHKDLIALAGAGGITDDAILLAGSNADVVIELIGGKKSALKITEEAIAGGSHVINANKALIAESGKEIVGCAVIAGLTIRYSASVGGVIPILETLKEYETGGNSSPVRSVRGVLNGTGNYVLGALARKHSYEAAVVEAQSLGYAEADPSRDLDGRDSLDKLLVIAQLLGWEIDDANISLGSITQWVKQGFDDCRSVRHVARLDANTASVQIEQVQVDDLSDPLGQLENEWNAAIIEFADGSTQVISGKGAGRWPTSESVFADLLELRRELVLANTRGAIANV
jgi:homoserine dehydrogenase